MRTKKVALFFLLVLAFEILFFTATEASPWWRRRRRRRQVQRPLCNTGRPSNVAWLNNWHGSVRFTCPHGQSLSSWRSQHLKCKNDRIHYFKCSNGPFGYEERHCSHTAYSNAYGRSLAFKCPRNGFIAGVSSKYDDRQKDRTFSFRCCHKQGHCAHDCKHTPFQNEWYKEIKYRVPYGYYLVGAFSKYDNNYKDREWNFEICAFTKSSICKRK